MSEQGVPGWASFYSPERFTLFGERVEAALQQLNKPFVLDAYEGSVRVIEPDGSKVYGLVNLAQICNQVPLDDWDAVILDFLSNLTRVHLIDDIPTDINVARPLLRIRLFPVENTNRSEMVTWPVAAEFLTCLAVDLPEKVVTVTQTIARSYGVSKQDLFEIAMRNVVEMTGAERQSIPVSDGAEIVSFSGPSFFVASLSLALDYLLGPPPEYGRLLAIPNRHNVMTTAIDSPQALDTLGLLVQAARGMFVEGPGSISPYVYWVRNGGWYPLEVEITEAGIGVSGPDSFVENVLVPLIG